MTQDCAPGTMFDNGKCSCVTSSKSGAGPMPGSNPRLESPFGGKIGIWTFILNGIVTETPSVKKPITQTKVQW